MVVDYEAAWTELAELIASKTQHGREQTLTAMAQIAANHRVPAGELSRLLRLYGVEVERARSMSTETDRDVPERLDGGLDSPADAEFPGHHDPTGGHDGRSRSDRNGTRHSAGAR